jgi:hypothetical protein
MILVVSGMSKTRCRRGLRTIVQRGTGLRLARRVVQGVAGA